MTYQPIFPASLQPAALALLRVLPVAELVPARQGFQVSVQGESLSAPSRVYYSPKNLHSVIATSTGDTRTLALCLGTRHCDGYIREECLRQVMAVDRAWVVPFIVQLAGEYVLEIVELIAAAVPRMNPEHLSEFAAANPQFMATTRQRATSYWDCYHRSRFKQLQTYPGTVALNSIEQPARSS